MFRIFAIPDIHGRNDLFQPLLKKLKDEHLLDFATDRLIFMGDMIDRGSDSKGVLDTIRALERDYPHAVVVLKGNHEVLCLNALRRGRWYDFSLWTHPANGGHKTLASFSVGEQDPNPGKQNPIPDDYLDWMDSLRLFHEEQGFFFSHAPCPKDKDRAPHLRNRPLEPCELVWTYIQDERGKSRHHKDKDGNKLVGVCGHIHRLQAGLFTPRYYQHYLFLDAGCGCSDKAPLVCTEVKSRTPIEVWPEGVTPIVPKKRIYIPPRPKTPSLWDNPI
jgi:serine/threonine protein phosphatase 1